MSFFGNGNNAEPGLESVNSCLFFSYSLTLVDALDTLAIMGNHSEFQRVAKLLEGTLNFEKDINVSVFETNIRGTALKLM